MDSDLKISYQLQAYRELQRTLYVLVKGTALTARVKVSGDRVQYFLIRMKNEEKADLRSIGRLPYLTVTTQHRSIDR